MRAFSSVAIWRRDLGVDLNPVSGIDPLDPVSSHHRDHTTTSAEPFEPTDLALLSGADRVNHGRRMCVREPA